MTSLIQILAALPWMDRLASALVQFLSQGALIALFYALVRSIFARRRTAGFRYGLSCAALLTMMVAPIATFVMSAPVSAVTPASSAASVAGSLASSHSATDVTWLAPMTDAALRTGRDDTTTWIVLAWFIGAIAFWSRLAGGWLIALRIRRTLVRPAPPNWQQHLDHLRMRLRLSRPVRLLVSAVVEVPTVFGWLRPVVLVPLGALTGLDPELVEALLAHELAHIRRHDYLVNTLQGVAETMLFYHPAVWWVSNQIRQERELCCDDIAVAICGDTLTYVRALTELESCRPVHINPALAATGGSLADRVARLLGVSRSGGTIAGSGVMTGTCLIVIVTALGALGQSAATSAPPPAFEVASVKQNKSGAARSPSMIMPGGRFTATNNTVRALILNAYGITASPSLLSGGPGWIDSEAYDIDARPAPNAIPAGVSGKPLWDKTRLMLRTLLADRFKLSMHRESKEMSIYELVVAKNGPKLKASAADCAASMYACHGFSGNPRRLTGTGVDAYDLALILTSYSDRLVVDKTGLQGTFDVFLQWNPFYGKTQQPADDSAPAPGAGREGAMPDLASLPSMFDALEQQVGLKLQAQKGPVEAWVIDHVERPSEN